MNAALPARNLKFKPWTVWEEQLLQQLYPTRGAEACVMALAEAGHARSVGAVQQRASGRMKLRGYRSKSHFGRGNPRYNSSAALDDAIRELYLQPPRKRAVLDFAERIGRPRWWVSKRATQLGIKLPRFKEPPWSDEELELLETHAYKNPEVIRRIFRRHGYARSETSITVKRKRCEFDAQDPEHYTAGGLARILGIDPKTPTRFIKCEGLPASKRGADRTEQQGGDQWWIRRKDLREWIIANHHLIDLRKITDRAEFFRIFSP